MIRIVKNSEKIDPQDLIGKWILRDGGYNWQAFGQPRYVADAKGQKLFVEKGAAKSRRDDDGHITVYLSDNEDRDPEEGYFMLASVKCICDTVEDVNLVLASSSVSQKEVFRVLREVTERAHSLDGQGVPMPEQTPKF